MSTHTLITMLPRHFMVAIALLVAQTLASSAQQPVHSPALVTLVASDSLSPGRRTEVVRRANRSPKNVILVDRNATPEDLAGAIALIQALRLQFGDTLAADLRAKPEAVRHSPTWQQSEYRKWIVQQLVRLRQAAPAHRNGLGVVTSVQVTLPFTGGTITSMSLGKP